MVMCLALELEIEDLRNHSQELIAHLRDGLAGAANVTPGPKWPHFYEVSDIPRSFITYNISPTTGKVPLIARLGKRSRKKAAYC